MQQKIIHQIINLILEQVPNQGREADAVQSPQGMVGGEDKAPLMGDTFRMDQLEMQVKIGNHAPHEIDTLPIMVAAQDLIQLLLVDGLGQISDQPIGNPMGHCRCFLLQYGLDVNSYQALHCLRNRIMRRKYT